MVANATPQESMYPLYRERHWKEGLDMRGSLVVVMLIAMLGCGSEPNSITQPADSGGNQAVSVTAKTPDAATVMKQMTSEQLALGDPIVNSIGMVLVPIPAGQFQMGSPDSDVDANENERPPHQVKLTKPFCLSAFEVTQGQYEKVMGSRPWEGKDYVREGPDYPATYVGWNDAVEFCRKLSEQEDVDYHLPTEAQWEYACRAGTTTVFSFGDDAAKLGGYAWYRDNAWDSGQKYAHHVGQKSPNSWGLYDMQGNVWEWCQDWHGLYGQEKTVSDPLGPAQSDSRVLRGGSIHMKPSQVRPADRAYGGLPADGNWIGGFRPARTYQK